MTATTHCPVARKPILAKFHTAVHEIYGARPEQVVLFSSQARGDGGADPDYDVAVFLNPTFAVRACKELGTVHSNTILYNL